MNNTNLTNEHRGRPKETQITLGTRNRTKTSKPQHRKDEQHVPHQKPGVNLGAREC